VRTTTGFLINSCVSADCDRFVGCHHVLKETEEIENFTCCEILGLRPKVSGQKGYLHKSMVFQGSCGNVHQPDECFWLKRFKVASLQLSFVPCT
jgi:hypothetical protein